MMFSNFLSFLCRNSSIAFFPLAAALLGSPVARADAGAEFTDVPKSAEIAESIKRVYAFTRQTMDYMGVSDLQYLEVTDAQSSLDVIRALISKLPPTEHVSLGYWCSWQPGVAGQNVNACAKLLLKKHAGRRYSGFAKSLISVLDPQASDFWALSQDSLKIAGAPESWLGSDYLEVSITDDYYSVDVMMSLMISRDLKRVVVAYYDYGA